MGRRQHALQEHRLRRPDRHHDRGRFHDPQRPPHFQQALHGSDQRSAVRRRDDPSQLPRRLGTARDAQVISENQLINNQTSYVKSTSQSVTELGKVQITQTGDWGNFVNSDKVLVKLSAGEQTIRIYDEGDGFNYRSFDLDYVKEFNEV